MKPQRLVLKIGTNVLQRPNGKLDYNQISEFTQLVAEIRSQKHEVLTSVPVQLEQDANFVNLIQQKIP